MPIKWCKRHQKLASCIDLLLASGRLFAARCNLNVIKHSALRTGYETSLELYVIARLHATIYTRAYKTL